MIHDLMDITGRRINMTHVAWPRDDDSNPLQPVIENSKTAFLFFALVLADHSPPTVVVYRGAVPGSPNKRNNRKGLVSRPIQKVLRIGLRGNCAAPLLLQPAWLHHETPQERFNRQNRISRLLYFTNDGFGSSDK